MRDFWATRANNYEQLDWVRQGYLQAFVTAGKFQSSDCVLDVGTGTGIVAQAVSVLVAKVTGIDSSPEMLAHAVQPISKVLVGNLHNLPFPDNWFDKVTARMVFHHVIEDSSQAMQECYRVLKPNGTMIFSEGVPPVRSLAGWYTHMFMLKEERLTFFENDLVALMESGGFDIEQVFTHISPQMSISNWLQNSGLLQARQNQIMQMHLDLEKSDKQHYNMIITDEDVLCDWKYTILTGSKSS